MVSTSFKRREKRKRQKLQSTTSGKPSGRVNGDIKEQEYEDVELVQESIIDVDSLDPELQTVYRKFTAPFLHDQEIAEGDEQEENEADELFDHEYEDMNDTDANQPKMSNKKLKQLTRIPLAKLKQMTPNPEVVELEDCTAKYSILLVQLKSAPHTIPVPRHWSRKRKYLAGKRGFLKPPFELPQFIKDTGVGEQRDAQRAIDDKKSLKAKARDRMHPKLGRMSVDYERLYDAFFKYQTKPPLSGYGQLYFEGKEGHHGEGKRRGMKPGVMSETLREALGMAPSPNTPPPWLFNMQRFGPPPAYPHLKVPGVNAPLPPGAVWGYHPGGWGRAPDNRFDNMDDDDAFLKSLRGLKPVESVLWGELEPL